MLEDELNTASRRKCRRCSTISPTTSSPKRWLCWVGRGTYDASEWDDAMAEAERSRRRNERIDELMDMPLLASDLEAGLAAFDISCDGVGELN